MQDYIHVYIYKKTTKNSVKIVSTYIFYLYYIEKLKIRNELIDNFY